MNYLKLENLLVFQTAMEINERGYPLIRRLRDVTYREQMTRAALSIPSNIAEGHGRMGNNEFAKFLTYSSGSARELSIQFELCKRLRLRDAADADVMRHLLDQECALLFGLHRKLKE